MRETMGTMVRWAGPVAGMLLVIASLPSARAQDKARGLPGVAAPRSVVAELQDTLGHATERLQARDEAGVLGHVSERYRSGSITKPAIREQLHALFGVSDTLWAKAQI